MRFNLLLSLLFLFIINTNSFSQVEVSGPCFGGVTYTLPSFGMFNGKEAFDGVGTVAGNPNTPISVYWEPAGPGWVLAFGGQPFYIETNDTGLPNSTSAGNWTSLGGAPCAMADITIAGPSTLPVELVFFKGKLNDRSIYLSWQTAIEINNLGFEVEISNNAVSWADLGFVDGLKNTSEKQNYSFVHENPSFGVNFYRLRQVDIDGSYKYSDIINFDIASEGVNVIVYPNPTTNVLNVSGDNIQHSQIFIYNQLGVLLESMVASDENVSLDISSFQKGNYILEIRNGRVLTMKKFVKI